MKYRIKKYTRADGVSKYMPQCRPRWFPFWFNMHSSYTPYKSDVEATIKKDIRERAELKIVKREIINYD